MLFKISEVPVTGISLAPAAVAEFSAEFADLNLRERAAGFVMAAGERISRRRRVFGLGPYSATL